ncbi:MAG: hypothetical protein U0325_13165 [Polyangiales bacterium]
MSALPPPGPSWRPPVALFAAAWGVLVGLSLVAHEHRAVRLALALCALLNAGMFVSALPGGMAYQLAVDAARARGESGPWPEDYSHLSPAARWRFTLRGLVSALLIGSCAHVLLPFAVLADVVGVAPARIDAWLTRRR